MDAPGFGWAGGVRVAGTPLTCDPERAPPRGALSFVSSARRPLGWAADPTRGRLLATGVTVALRRALKPGGEAAAANVLTASTGRPFALGRLRLELLPAGHVPGAAQLLVERGDGARLLYAGVVNPAPGALADPPQARACDVLALAAPLLAVSTAPLPPRAEVEAALVRRVTTAAGPLVVQAPALGAAGEVARLLLGRAHVVAPPPTVRLLTACVTEGLLDAAAVPGPVGRAAPAPGTVLLWPAGSPPPAAWSGASCLRVGLQAVAAPGPDAFPLCDEGDLPGLAAHVRACEPRRVFVTTALPEPALAALRAAVEIPVTLLTAPRQMALAFARTDDNGYTRRP